MEGQGEETDGEKHRACGANREGGDKMRIWKGVSAYAERCARHHQRDGNQHECENDDSLSRHHAPKGNRPAGVSPPGDAMCCFNR